MKSGSAQSKRLGLTDWGPEIAKTRVAIATNAIENKSFILSKGG